MAANKRIYKLDEMRESGLRRTKMKKKFNPCTILYPTVTRIRVTRVGTGGGPLKITRHGIAPVFTSEERYVLRGFGVHKGESP